jgi:cell division protease FtsH
MLFYCDSYFIKFQKYHANIKIYSNPFSNNNKYYEDILKIQNNTYNKKYPLSKDYFEGKIRLLNSKNITIQNENILNDDFFERDSNSNDTKNKKYPHSKDYFEGKIRLLNSKNITIQNENILNDDLFERDSNTNDTKNLKQPYYPQLRIILSRQQYLNSLGLKMETDFENNADSPESNFNDEDNDDKQEYRKQYGNKQNAKSKHFEVIQKCNTMFNAVGGYENVKQELNQCIDILKNYKKYIKYNVRLPKGLILEGPPGNGKTLISKALAGESNCAFIAVSGSDFQEKYVGVGSSRIKELFKLARENIPCIIFIDEIDALGRKRSTDSDSSSSERDSTLNSLLVELDGFKNSSGIFIIAATNRVDLLDTALTRPGRIDKKIYIGLPDAITRESIINIHIKGKPYDNTIIPKDLVEITEGFSGAQIENLLNEAMLHALRYNNTKFSYVDFDLVLNKMIAGWQPNEHAFTSNIIDRIAIHEMGHAIVGILSKHHSKVTKVVINLSSPKSPGYTVFEGSTSNIYIREGLFEHLMILLAGRIAEEVFYGVSVTTGAINDFEEALILAEKMIKYYGMGENIIYPSLSEKYKEAIDNEVLKLINQSYECAQFIIMESKELIYETSEILKVDKLLKADMINRLIRLKYSHLLEMKQCFE